MTTNNLATANGKRHRSVSMVFIRRKRKLYAHVKYLNLINVFPVADGDTGTNLAVTLRAMVESAKPIQSFQPYAKNHFPVGNGRCARQLRHDIRRVRQRSGAWKAAATKA